MKTIRLAIVVDDNGAIQKLQLLDNSVNNITGKTPGATKGTQDFAGALRQVGGELDKVVPGSGQLVGAFASLASGSIGAVAGIAAVGVAAAATAAGVIYLVNQQSNYAQSLENLSRRTGVALEPLQLIGAMAKSSGVDINEMGDAIGQLTRRISAGDPTVNKYLAELGINLDNIRKQNPYEMFIQVGEALGRQTDQAYKNEAGVALMGRTFLSMSQIYTTNMREMIEKQREFNIVQDPEAIQALVKYGQQIDTLGIQWQRFKTNALGPVAQALSDILTLINSNASTWEKLLLLRSPAEMAADILVGGTKPTLAPIKPMASHGATPSVPSVPGATSRDNDYTALNAAIESSFRSMGAEAENASTRAQRALQSLRDQAMQPLSEKSIEIAREMKAWGSSNEDIARTLKGIENNANITSVTVARYFAAVERAKESDQAWGEAQKALAVSLTEGINQQVAIEEAAHLTRVKLIRDTIQFSEDRNKQLEVENQRHSSALIQIEAETARKIRDLQQEAAYAAEAQATSHYGTMADRQKAALAIEQQKEYDSIMKIFGATEEGHAAILALYEKYAAKRMSIEEGMLRKTEVYIRAELDARQRNMAAMGMGLGGESLSDPFTKAENDRIKALEALQVAERAGADTRQQAIEIERKYQEAIDAGNKSVYAASTAMVQASGSAGIMADHITRIGEASYASKSAIDNLSASLQAFSGYAESLSKAASAPGSLLGFGTGQMVQSTISWYNQPAYTARRAGGGSVDSGRPYWVGEGGPELFVPRQSGTIIPNGGGMSIMVDARGAVFENDRALDRLTDKIAQRIGQKYAR